MILAVHEDKHPIALYAINRPTRYRLRSIFGVPITVSHNTRLHHNDYRASQKQAKQKPATLNTVSHRQIPSGEIPTILNEKAKVAIIGCRHRRSGIYMPSENTQVKENVT